MKLLFVVLAFVGFAIGSDKKHAVSYDKQYSYHGKYGGKCDNDGFYYKDEYTFVICSNNNAYVQPCAPGSRNSGYERYHYGKTYYYRDFCDVNLVDHGYGVKHYGGYDNKAPYHGESKHHQVSDSKQYQYHGKYSGKCSTDGFYYKDDDSFVICSNNNAHVQACAPGTRNSGYNNYYTGSAYYYRDFCDVNLVDHGYGVHYDGYVNKGYDNKGYGYEGAHYGGNYHQYERKEHYGNKGYGYNEYETGYGK